MAISDIFRRLFGLQKITKITIQRETLAKVAGIAGDTHPKEMLVFLEGEVKKGTLEITDILFQPYIASNNSVFSTHIDLPLTSKSVGTIHSHPGFRNKPSTADLHFFRKHGIIHGIICQPYNEKSIQFYDFNGEPATVNIV